MYRPKGYRLLALMCTCLLGVFSGCAPQKSPADSSSATESGVSAVEESSSEAAEKDASGKTDFSEKEQVKITLASSNISVNSADDQYWPSPLVTEMQKRLNLEMEFLYVDREQMNVMMAGGDLPDMVNADKDFISTMIQSGQVMELDKLVETNGPDIQKNYPKRLDFSKQFLSNGTGKIYALPTVAGLDRNNYVPRYGYIMRMDYYLEQGKPKIGSWDDYLQYLKKAQEAHPVTADGKKVYGIGIYNDWGPLWGWHGTTGFAEGYLGGVGAYVSKPGENELISLYKDQDASLWKTLNYMYKMNQMGLMDPDSFTMKNSDWKAKVQAGQYLSATQMGPLNNQYYKPQLAKDPDFNGGFFILPTEDFYCEYGFETEVGYPSKSNAITTNCKNPERAMDLLNFWFSEEGCRLQMSGIEGEDYTLVDGKPVLGQTALDLKMQGGDAYSKRFSGVHTNLLGFSAPAISSVDGEPMSLFETKAVRIAMLTSMEKQLCELYDAEEPSEIYQKMVEEGKMFDCSELNVDIPTAMPETPDDIKRLDVKLEDIMVKGIPKVVLAKDDAAYKAAQEEILKDLEAAGVERSVEWWTTEWNKAKAFLEK